MNGTETEEGIVEFLFEGGAGDEASVRVELRTMFPGLGGTIVTQEGAVTAFRRENYAYPKEGQRMFMRHMILKKLEDFFYRTHVYKFSHIPRPLGSISRQDGEPCEAYIYEWAFGREGFPWEEMGRDGNKRHVILSDWNEFVESFGSAGIDVKQDIVVADSGVSKNIIHLHPYVINEENLEMNCLWKRIDMGCRSLRIDFEMLERYLHDRKAELMRVLRNERYHMIGLASEYLTQDMNGKKMREADIGKLEVRIGDYRKNTLMHYTSRGTGLTECRAEMDEGSETLL